MPWLMRFAWESLPRQAEANAQAIAALLTGAGPLWTELADRIGGSAILQPKGCLYLYETSGAYRAAHQDMTGRRALGIEFDLIGPEELRQMEPNLPVVAGGAAFFPKAVFMADPSAMVQRLATHLEPEVQMVRARADKITRCPRGVTVTGPDLNITAKRVVIAAGAHSRALARSAGDNVPLDTERGYHVEWDMIAPRLMRPTCPTARGFYLCPMSGRLRVAGTVELGGLTAAPSQHRIEKLIEGARAFFPDLVAPDRTWMGFRPSMPDSRPVIGPSRQGDDVIHAYGHGHIGLTLAPITAELVADVIAGREPARDLTPYRVNRF